MGICIVDFQPGGHHRFYIQQIVDLPGVTAFVGHEDLADLFGERRELMAITTVNAAPKNESDRIKILKQHVCEHPSTDEFFLMEADQLSKMLLSCAVLGKAAISGIPVGGIWFRSNFLYRKGLVAFAKRKISMHLLSIWSKSQQRLYFLDDQLAGDIAARCGADKHFYWCREPYAVDLKTNQLESRAVEEPVTLLFVGSQARRKGTAWAIRALVGSQFSRQITIHIAGVIHDEDVFVAIELARDAGIEVIVDNRFLDSSEYDAAFKQCSIVMLPYCDFGGSSGVLIEAAQYRKPVIATSYGTLGRIVRSSGWGEAYTPGDEADFVSNLSRLINGLEGLESNQGYKGILDRCSSDEFIKKIAG